MNRDLAQIGHQHEDIDVTEPLAAPRQSLKPMTFTSSDKWVGNGWTLEILAVLIGTALNIVMLVILKIYDNKPNPNLGSVDGRDFTLNSAVSILSTFSVTLLLYAVVEATGQLKWTWFSSSDRPIEILDDFTRASQGPLGGASLLWSLRARSPAAVGAVLMLLQLAVHPLVQNAVTLYSAPVGNDNPTEATIPFANEWTDFPSGYDLSVDTASNISSESAISINMQAAVQSGMASGTNIIKPLNATCSTGNCTFTPYSSLAICSTLADITSHVTQAQKKANGGIITTFSIPGGPVLESSNVEAVPVVNISSAAVGSNTMISRANFSNSIAFRNATSAIADVFVLYRNETDSTYNAVELMLNWCILSVNTTVTNGVSTTTTLASFANFDSNLNIDLPANEKTGGLTYLVDLPTHYGLQYYFRNQFMGNGTWHGSNGVITTTSNVVGILFQPLNRFTHSPVSTIDTLGTGHAGLSSVIANIATSMTNLIREFGGDAQPGKLITQETTVSVVWGYTAGPILFNALCLLFFVSTLLFVGLRDNRRRMPLWKSSDLVLLHALHPDMQKALGGMKSLACLKEQDSAIYARLTQVGENDWRLITATASEDVHDGIPL